MKYLNFSVAIIFILSMLHLNTVYGQSTCAPSTSQVDSDISNVRAKILGGGDMWWDAVGTPTYEVPKNSGKHSLFAGALWIGGIDGMGQLKMAAQTYRQTGNDFWPGPLNTTTKSILSSSCLAYDKHWKITKQEVQNFVNNGTMTPNIITWPGNGNLANNNFLKLAPFNDTNADGIYDPSSGDYPGYNLTGFFPGGQCLDYLFGDQTVWWVINDAGNIHTETGSPIMGLEIRCQAFAFYSSDEDVNNTTFYQYQIINVANVNLNEAYVGTWVDTDLGFPFDDYVACDIARGLGYSYNGDNNDEFSQGGYGMYPPAIGIDIMGGPLADSNDGIDNDRDGVTDEIGERIIMSNFMTYNNMNGPPNGNPSGATHFYNYLKSVWGDNQHLTYGGDGRGTSNPSTNFMYPDSSNSNLFPTQGPWSEVTAANIAGDRRLLMSAGPFTMLPGAINYVTTSVVWARDTVNWHNSGITKLQTANDKIQSMFDNCFSTVPTSINYQLENIKVRIFPNPFQHIAVVNINVHEKSKYVMKIFNINGKLVESIDMVNGNNEIHRGTKSPGLYLYTLNAKNGQEIKQGKILIN